MVKTLATSFILHSRPFKETSLLLSLFSKEFGRFSLIAKGIKRKNSQALRAILQPFSLLEIEYTGRSELKTLCHAELVAGQTRMPNKALACGYYLNELIMRSIQEWQEFPDLFACYKQSVFKLQSNLEPETLNPTLLNYAAILRNFEVSLLSELGVAPAWDVDVSGAEICADAYYHFIVEQGFELIEKESPRAYSGQAILNLGRSEFSAESVKSSQHISQMLLRQIIGDKPLESRKLWL